jgi:hypothetical protein
LDNRRLNPVRSYGIPRLLLGLLLSGAAMTLTAAPFFKPFTASFSVWRGAIPLGSLQLNFSLNEGQAYSYRAHTRPGLLAGLFSGDEVIEESRGRLGDKRVLPNHYSYHETGNREDNAEVRFDWPANKVYTSSGGITWAQEIAAGTQDRLSQQLMVRLQLAQGEKDLSYQVADGGKLKHYRFQVVGKEPVKTPYGQLHCLKVRRSKEQRLPDYTIWFAPELDYLPVRIEREQGSGRYHLVLEELEGF